MSVIDKYPFINAVLTSLSDEDIASLQECVNGAGGSSVFKSILAGSPHLLKTTDKGVYPIELEVAPSGTAQTVYPGFLIYNDDYCVLISFATERSQILTVLDLHLVNGLWSYEIKPFELSITDLRSELFDVAGGGGGASPSDVVSIVNNALNNDSIDIAGRFAAPEYDPEETYAAGSVVAYNNRIYVAKEDSITGEWNSAKWDEKKLTELVGGSGESIEVDLYFSDFDLSGNTPVVTNQEKAEKLKSVLAKDDKDFIYLFANFPYLVDPENLDNEFGGKMSFYPSYFLNLKAFISLSSGSANSQVVVFTEQNDELVAAMLQFPEWYTEALFTAMATDATKHISLKFTVGAGSSVSPNPEPVAGGSGKLYEYKYTLQAYDNNGNVVSHHIAGHNVNSLNFVISVYESNFERFKNKFNSVAQTLPNAPTLNTPEELVDIINTYFDQTTYDATGNIFMFLYWTIEFADKVQIKIPVNQIVDEFCVVAGAYIVGTLSYIWSQSVETINLSGLDNSGETALEYYCGLNVNNSCTLTEYGTSASGGSGGTYEPIEIEIGSSDMTAGGKIENSTISNIVKDALENKSIDYIEIEVYENDPNDYVGDIVIRYSNICSNYIKGLDTVVLTAGDYEVGTSSGGSATFISSISIAADKAFEVISNTSGVYIQTGSILGTLITHTLSANKKVKIRLYEADKGGGSSSGSGTSAESPYCYIQIGSGSANLIYMFDRAIISRPTMTTEVNTLITGLNSMFSTNIPAYTQIGDLVTISQYINQLDTSNYATLKVVFWASLFTAYQYLALTVKLYRYATDRWISPVMIQANADQGDNNFMYNIMYIDDSMQLTNLWSSLDTFDFLIRVDDLD